MAEAVAAALLEDVYDALTAEPVRRAAAEAEATEEDEDE